VETATEAIKLDTQETSAFPYLIRAVSLTELLALIEEVLQSVNKYLTKEPENSQALFVKGNILEQLERYDEALETYAKAARSRDGHIRGCIARGLLLSALGRSDEGLAEFDKVLPKEPSVRAEELAKLKTLIAESATRYDALGRHEQAERLREASSKIG
jgi:tetratricopeptide (TPR) repeat protein